MGYQGLDDGRFFAQAKMDRETESPTSLTVKSHFERLDVIIFASIVVAAFVLRLVYVVQYWSSPAFSHPIMDPLCHAEWAGRFDRAPVGRLMCRVWLWAGGLYWCLSTGCR